MNLSFPFPLNGKTFCDLNEKERRFFVEDEYLPLPPNHASQILLLDEASSEQVKSFAKSKFGLSFVYTESFFTTYGGDLSSLNCYSDLFMNFPFLTEKSLHGKWNNDAGLQDVRNWLYSLKIPFDRQVLLWYDFQIVSIPWKLVVRYWDAFAWSVGNYMLSFDSTASWVCQFHHEEVISCWSTKSFA